MENNPHQDEEFAMNHILEQIVSASQALPLEENLQDIQLDARAANQRGYYLPDEDERLRLVFSDYLRLRSILLDTINHLQPFSLRKKSWKEDLEAFTMAYTAASLLIRSATYIIDTAKALPVIWKKLDEAEERFGIERKTLSKIYKSLTSPVQMWRFFEATRYYNSNKSDILDLRCKSIVHEELISLLEEEEQFIESKRRSFFKKRFKYRFYDLIRSHKSGYKKTMFHIFRLTGSAIAEIKQPFKSSNITTTTGKRVGKKVIQEIQRSLKPGDILITRHDDALSNLFLPGFWPHAAFYTGTDANGYSVVESKKDGVKLRMLDETLYVDSFLVLRSNLSTQALDLVIQKAKSHVGKRYDFLFDFTQADRLACTELVYRSFHATDGITFNLQEHTKRMCLSAEDLINQAMSSKNFECIAIYGLPEKEDSIVYGDEAKQLLQNSYTSQWS